MRYMPEMGSVRVFLEIELSRTVPKRVKAYKKLRDALKKISVVGIGLHFLRTEPISTLLYVS
jgi:hypothetical protein